MGYRFNKQRPPSHKRHSKYTGVKWSGEHEKWYSILSENKVSYHCGFHDDDRAAAKARDMKIIQINSNKPLQVLKPNINA